LIKQLFLQLFYGVVVDTTSWHNNPC
jgi:hypothetical protein